MSKPIIVMTALELEREAVEKHLLNMEVIKHPSTGTDYTKGNFFVHQKKFDVIVGRTDQTNINAALETERALEFFDPEYVFFVGIAGGLKDVVVGDIVIGADVYGFERGKAEENNFKPRPKFGSSTYELERMAGNYSKSEDWKQKSINLNNPEFSDEIRTYTGTIASGEKVDASNTSDLHLFLKQNVSHALAIEMEGMGFLEVCRMRPAVKTLLLRGISDLVGNKGEMDGKGSQPYASQNVSEFLFGIIGQLNLTHKLSEKTSVEEELRNIMCTLYPGGLRDNGIWITAGGNLALVNLLQTGKGQWSEALRLVTNGGGGSITFKSLLKQVMDEYPNNKDVLKLYNEYLGK